MSTFVKQEMIEKIELVPQLDGKGNLYLILQVKSASNEGPALIKLFIGFELGILPRQI